MSEYDNRLILAEYANDEPVHVYVPDGGERWIPERLWFRLVNLGRAYQTHLLPLLPGAIEPQTLNGQQVVALADEVEFLVAIVDDEALSAVVADLRPVLDEARSAQTFPSKVPRSPASVRRDCDSPASAWQHLPCRQT